MRRWARNRAVLPGAVAAVLWLLAPGSRVEAETQQAPVPAPAAACAACHPEATASWAASLHRRTVGAPQIAEARQACAACHTGTAEHLADLGDESKRPSLKGKTGDEIAAICQQCHRGGKQTLWALSAHARTKDACLTCHDPHAGKGEHMLKAEEPELCATCHPTAVQDTKLPFHHPIPEGKMTCTDCHNVHGDDRAITSGANAGEMCFRCHAEKEGPFQAEHPPVTEDCTICHRPHGSPVENLLIAEQPALCLQCHPGHSDAHRTPIVSTSPNDPQARNAIAGFYGKCTSCHSRIHGTDLLSGTGNPTFMPGSPLSQEVGAPVRAMAGSATDESLWGFSDISLGRIEEHGNQTYVRQYDGRKYDNLDTDLSVTRYDKDSDLRVEIVDLPIGDQDLHLRYGTPTLDVKGTASGLTHRLGRYDDFTDATIPGQNGGTNRVNTTDLSEGKNDYHLNRTLIDLQVAARCPKVPQAKVLAEWWQEREHGSRQFLFLDRCTSCHKIQTTEPIDRVTTIVKGGVQVDLPKASLRYLRSQLEFHNEAPEELFKFNGRGLFNGLAPLFGVAPSEVSTNDVRGAAALSSRAAVAALWQSKERHDELGGGRLDLRTAGGGGSYALSPHLLLQSSYFARHQDVADIAEGVSRDWSVTRADLRYTGIPHATWSLGVTRQTVSRESERDFVPTDSDSTIWRSALTYRPFPRLSLQAQYRNTQTDNSGFFDPAAVPAHFPSRLIGLPTDGSQLSAVLGYNLGTNTFLSGIYSRLDNTYEVEAPELGISRSDDVKTESAGVQLLHTRGRSHLALNYYHQTGSTLTDATYGTDAFTLSPPLSPENLVFPPIESQARFGYQASILGVEGAWWKTRRLRLFGAYNQTLTNGHVTAFDLGDYIDQNPDLNGLAVTLNPFDIDIRDFWVGMGYLLEPDTEAVLSFQRRSWTDTDNPTHNGSFGLWRVGLRRQF